MTAARLAKTVAAPTAKNSFIFTILGTKWGILWLWLLIINVVAFLAYGGDKLLAKLKEHQPKVPRLPEKNLLLFREPLLFLYSEHQRDASVSCDLCPSMSIPSCSFVALRASSMSIIFQA